MQQAPGKRSCSRFAAGTVAAGRDASRYLGPSPLQSILNVHPFPRSGLATAVTLAALAVVLPFPAPAPAQSGPKTDLRDTVTLTDGRRIRGRVVSRFAKDELVVVQGGRRQRFARKRVRDVHTINDDLRQFFAHRKKIGGNPKRAWILVEWAASKNLDGMARLQALSLVFEKPKFEKAHVFLGHKLRGKDKWLWPVGDRHRKFADYQKHHAKWGSALQLTGEHFKVKTTAGVSHAVKILLDLERMYLFFEDTFGAGVQTEEVLKPIEMHVYASLSRFPSISSRKLPYYDPRSDHGMTFFLPDGKRPAQLFAIAAQSLLFHTLAGGRASQTRGHVCAWVEIGLGQWMESAFGGKPGVAAPLPKVSLDTLVASTVSRMRPRLKRTTHLQYDLFHELSRRVNMRWDATNALVHFLMSEKPDPKRRQRFMDYLRQAFHKGLGDSSSAFDAAMGEPVEKLQVKFFRWLQTKT